jgi:N6-L-threonylcarbamoyladenine synthase
MIVLGIESSCDETATAILSAPRSILASLVSSQNDIHAKFGGVVPELASRRHMEMIVPLFEESLKTSGVALRQIDGIAVTRAPGLIGALLVGLSFAKSLAYVLDKPIVGVNHLEGHLNAAHLEHDIEYPYVGLVISGGHTSLYHVKKFGNYKLLGATRDDAAGEAFDKVAKLLGLGYPGGPIIDKISRDGDPKAFRFTKPKMNKGSKFEKADLDFSFSGIKTAVMLEFKGLDKKSPSQTMVADMAASFQRTVVDIVCSQIVKACQKTACKSIVVSGGVAANSALRAGLKNICEENGINLYLPSLKFCTDNAAMIAYAGAKRLAMGNSDDLSLFATANEEIGVK